MIRLADQLYHEATTVCTFLALLGTGPALFALWPWEPLALQLLAAGPAEMVPPSIVLDQSRRGIGKSQSAWTAA
eukprot:COSAG01_NODE_1553_length_9931_cov_3.092657_3_plen_74_part_00